MLKAIIYIFMISLIFFSSINLKSHEDHTILEIDNQIALLFGVGQILYGGFNIEGNVFYNNLVFDYSHGISLNTPNSALEDGDDKNQNLAVHIPWTTGFGVGYIVTDWLNVRLEPKWHKYEIFYEGENQIKENLIVDYTTFTLGVGVYINYRPFKKYDNFLKGIMIAPNIRYWPNIWTSLENDSFTYNNEFTSNEEKHKARNIGMGNTPFFVNISVGYSINF